MQKPTERKKKVMVKYIIPAVHLKSLQSIQKATGITPSKLFVVMLDRIGEGFKVEDVPMGETGMLRLYLDREHFSRLKRLARTHGAGTSVFIRAIIAHELAKITKKHKSSPACPIS